MENNEFKTQYRVGKKIRNVDFGCIRYCIQKNTNFSRNVRVYIKSMMDITDRKFFFIELNHMKELSHPCIAKFIDFFED